MYKDLEDKIEREYRDFQVLMLATSRENIFSKAEEICFKTQIRSMLLNLNSKEKINHKCKDKLMLVQNVIDSVYLYCCDYKIALAMLEDTIAQFLLQKDNVMG